MKKASVFIAILAIIVMLAGMYLFVFEIGQETLNYSAGLIAFACCLTSLYLWLDEQSEIPKKSLPSQKSPSKF